MKKEDSFYKSFNGMCWPDPCSERLIEIHSNLLHGTKDTTRSGRLLIASVLNAYRALILDKTQKNRNSICEILKEQI